MKTYRGGERVNRGVYCNLASWEFFQGPENGAVLPGGGDSKYIRMPASMVLLAGPLMGLGFVVFLPLVGIVGLGLFLGRALARPGQRMFEEAAQVVVPSWVPGVSYLVRGRRSKAGSHIEAKKPVAKEMDPELGGLERELQERRRKWGN